MKTAFLTIMVLCVFYNSFAQTSQIAAKNKTESSTDVFVDGKYYNTISGEANSYTMSVPFTNGRHEIRWTRKNDQQRPFGPDPGEMAAPEDATESIQPLPGREDLIDRTIEIEPEERDSIRVDIYDNGVVDNDSVSVFTDNMVVIANKKVSAKPLTFYTSMLPGRQMKKIKMEAQNLGLIPPNTSLMVITTKHNKYILPLTSTLTKNACVQLVLKKNQ